MKLKYLHILFITLAAMLAFSCVNPNGPSTTITPQEEDITPGWYLYTTNADTDYPQATYLYINTSGAVERAGSSSYEYTDSQLDLIKVQLSYSVCKKNADGTVITFKRTEAPSWATENNNSGDEDEKCPYAEGEYLDVTKHLNFSWPVNKKLQLWSAKEYQYSCSCLEKDGYINSEKVFIAGASLSPSADTTIAITLKDTDGKTYTCRVTFTAASSSDDDNSDNNNDSGNSWGLGYEWWCFEDAYTGPLDCFVLYDTDENPVKAGTNKKEETNSLYLNIKKTQAIKNFRGACYQITDYSQLPSWCF